MTYLLQDIRPRFQELSTSSSSTSTTMRRRSGNGESSGGSRRLHARRNGRAVRVGTLTRDADGAVSFVVAESFLRDAKRPILSLGWYDPDSDQGTHKRLASRGDKIGLHGRLPPWFSGLLSEGALRDLVMTEMGPGDHDDSTYLPPSERTWPARRSLSRRPTYRRRQDRWISERSMALRRRFPKAR